MIADFTNKAWRKDLFKSFASVNKPLNDLQLNEQSSQGRSSGCGYSNSCGKSGGGIGRGALSGNQGLAKDTLNKYGWCK